MLDASTTVHCLIPYLTQFRDLLVITNGAKSALSLATLGIKTICTGGELALGSFVYFGPDAEIILRKYNANVAFFLVAELAKKGWSVTTASWKIQ